MDMGHSDAPDHACKISMLWNWFTVDACFVSSQWHVRSNVAFAFTVICVFILVALVEGVRRASRNYDRRISQAALTTASNTTSVHSNTPLESKAYSHVSLSGPAPSFTPTWSQQLVRGGFFFVQFGAAYILMLLAMYYNGFVIFAIILGGTAGHIIFGRDTVAGAGGHGDEGGSCC